MARGVPTYENFRRSLAGTPMSREARGIYNAARRSGINPAFVSGLAAAESSYGTKGYARGTYNPYGLGVHLGMKFPNYTKATQKLGSTLQSLGYPGLYKKRGIAGVISQYTPASDGNDESAHIRNIISYGKRTKGNPSLIYTGAAMQQMNAAPMSDPYPQGRDGVAKETNVAYISDKVKRMLSEQYQRTLSGTLSPEFARETTSALLANIAQSGRSRALSNPGPLPPSQSPTTLNLDQMGIGYGGVDSKKITKGGEGGNWGGSMPRALQFLSWAKGAGYKPNTSGNWLSQKRSRKLTASGNPSDHWSGSSGSYAVDLGVPNAKSGDKLLSQIMAQFGRKDYKGGSWLNVNKGGYRYQIGWRVPGHYDHIHVGVRKN